MTFDSRSRQAGQGIRRAVEEMEMSSTKTPQRQTRFEDYRQRKSRNKRITALVVGIAIPILLVIGAVRVFGSGNGSAPAVQPSVSVTPPPVSGRSRDVFEAPFTYTVPGDWTFAGAGNRNLSFETPGASGTDVIVLSNVVAAKADCSTDPKQGVGTSSEAMMRWLSTNPALDATTPHPVELGAATGSYVDVKLAKHWNNPCGPSGPVLVTAAPDDIENWGIAEMDKERLYVLDLPSGDTVTIVIDTFPSASFGFQSLIDEAAPVVESFRFLR